MTGRPRWRVVVCTRCRLPVEAIITASPYIPLRGMNLTAQDHATAYGHWPVTSVIDAEQEIG